MNLRLPKTAALFLFSMLLAACGGGGGGQATPSGPILPDPPALFSVTGTVSASGGSAADSDVNDVAASYTSNDTCDTAQALPNPVSLGGYVNAPGAGEDGRSFAGGDTDDVYRVSLLAGQTVTLYISEDGSLHDIDLVLVDAACGTTVDLSQGLTSVEVVTAPADGDYFIGVYVFCADCGGIATASNYNLVIGQTGLTAHDGLNTGDDFMPGEVVVTFTETLGAMSASQTENRVAAMGLELQSGAAGGPMVLRIDDGSGGAKAFSALGVEKKQPRDSARLGIEIPAELQARLDTIAVVRALRMRTDVAAADLNYFLYPSRVPNDEFYGQQWHYPQINLPAAWDLTQGDGVIVAVIDTGVLLNHPDLQGRLVAGYDFISDPSNALDGNGRDADPDDPGDRRGPSSQSSFHGTHVAGTIAARGDNGVGVAGVAWDARIMPLRALGARGGLSADVMQAVLFAAGLPNASGTLPPRRADIINLSLGGGSFSTNAQDVYTRARNAGVIIVAAAGNESSAVPSYPASYSGVISVSAVGADKSPAPYSNFGTSIDVAAPGGDASRDLDGDGFADGVLSLGANDGSAPIEYRYVRMQGTSMAAPHVAGVLALMKAIDPSLTPDRVDSLLSSGAITEDLGAAGRDNRFGWGLIDAFKAVQAAGATATPAPLLLANPESLNFATHLNSMRLQVRNAGSGSPVIAAPTTDAEWLSVTLADGTLSDERVYSVTVDRSGLPSGVYGARITIDSDAGTLQVPVIMQVDPAGAVDSDAGFHWMILVDPETFETVQTVNAPNVGGRYAYRFTDVPPGRYLLFTGTDLDNDDLICDPGEACGAWPTMSSFVELNVEGNLSDVDFVTSYDTEIGAATVETARPGFSRTPASGKQLRR